MKGLKKVIAVIIIGVCFFFIIRATVINWHLVNLQQLDFNILYLFLAFIFFVCYFIFGALILKITLKYLGEKIKLNNALKIISLSNVGKYIPGKIWSIIAQVWLSKKEGIKEEVAITWTILFTIMNVLSGLILSIAIFYVFLPTYGLIIIIFGLFIILHPKIFIKILSLGFRMIRKKTTEINIKYAQILKVLLLYIIFWFFQCSGVYFLICSFYYIEYNFLFRLLGIYPFAFVIAFSTFITPAGLGVKEGVLSYLLNFYIPTPIAGMSSIIIRLWNTICEIIFFLIFVKNIKQYIMT